MPLQQLDLFGWYAEREQVVTINQETDITVDALASALIKHFGHWVDKSPRLLADDWTVCETLVGIHHTFSREELKALPPEVWKEAWERFEKRYLTRRPRSDFYWKWPQH